MEPPCIHTWVLLIPGVNCIRARKLDSHVSLFCHPCWLQVSYVTVVLATLLLLVLVGYSVRLEGSSEGILFLFRNVRFFLRLSHITCSPGTMFLTQLWPLILMPEGRRTLIQFCVHIYDTQWTLKLLFFLRGNSFSSAFFPVLECCSDCTIDLCGSWLLTGTRKPDVYGLQSVCRRDQNGGPDPDWTLGRLNA